MHSFVLKENVLTDDLLLIPEVGKIFRGQYTAMIKAYSFLNSWEDKEEVLRFRNKERLLDFLKRKYPNADIDFTGTCLE